MKAIVYDHYGPPEVLRVEDLEKPRSGDDQLLVKVHASSVNPYDWHFIRGTPSFIRLFAGLRVPKFRHLGADVAGVVEAVGRNISSFKVGDAVFGTAKGAFAEYVCAPRIHSRSQAGKPHLGTSRIGTYCRNHCIAGPSR